MAYAQNLAANGDNRLAEYCTIAGAALQDRVGAAWAVHEAPQRIAAACPGRIAKLRKSSQAECTCNGVWRAGAVRVLSNNGEHVSTFCHDVFRALALGAKRGVNLAIVGPPGSVWS